MYVFYIHRAQTQLGTRKQSQCRSNQMSTHFTALFQVLKHLFKRLIESVFDNRVHELEEPRSIFVIHKPIVEDTEDLVNKQAYHGVLVFQRLLLH